eukprot:63598_1
MECAATADRFMMFMELLRSLRTKDLTLIFNVIRTEISPSDLRGILISGFIHHLQPHITLKSLTNLNEKLQHRKATQLEKDLNTEHQIMNTITNTNTSLHNTHSILTQKDIICNIFSFLDLHSLLKCEKVCHFWLKSARDPSCIILFDYLYSNKKNQIPHDILRFRCCKQLKLNINNITINDLTFNNISQLLYFNKCTHLTLYHKNNNINKYNKHTIKKDIIKTLHGSNITNTIQNLYLFGDFDDKLP